MSPTYRILHNTGIDANVIVDDKVIDQVFKKEMLLLQESIKRDVDNMSKLNIGHSRTTCVLKITSPFYIIENRDP